MKTTHAFFNQFSEDQIKKQYAANIKCLEDMVNCSKKTGTYNGYTTDQLESKLSEYKDKIN